MILVRAGQLVVPVAVWSLKQRRCEVVQKGVINVRNGDVAFRYIWDKIDGVHVQKTRSLRLSTHHTFRVAVLDQDVVSIRNVQKPQQHWRSNLH